MPKSLQDIANERLSQFQQEAAEAPAQSYEDLSPEDINSYAGMDISQFEILPQSASGSSPDMPIIADSPVSLADRFRLSFGNEQGRMDYLKNNFEEVSKNADGELVVKDNGSWKLVDPSTLGDSDAWSLTEKIYRKGGEFAKDIADSAGTLTQIAPSLLASPTILGAAAGAVAGEVARSSLGRLMGTYDASSIEMGQDLAFEALLNAGGAAIIPPVIKGGALALKAYGVPQALGKLGYKMVENIPGVETVGNVIKNLQKDPLYRDATGRDALKGLMRMSGKSAKAADRALDTPAVGDIVVKTAGKLRKQGVNESDVLDKMGGTAQSLVKLAAKAAKQELSTNMDQLSKQAVEAASKSPSFRVNVGNTVTDMMSQMVDGGFVTPVAKTIGGKVNTTYTVASNFEEQLNKFGLGGDLQTRREFTKFVDQVNKLKYKYGSEELTGRKAAEGLKDVKTSINKLVFNSGGGLKGSPADDYKAAGQLLKTSVDYVNDVATKAYTAAGPEALASYKAMNNYWSKNIDMVSYMNKVVRDRNPERLRTLTESMMGKPGSPGTGVALQNTIKELSDPTRYKGLPPRTVVPRSVKLLDKATDFLAAREFVSGLPQKVNSGFLDKMSSAAFNTAISPKTQARVARQIARTGVRDPATLNAMEIQYNKLTPMLAKYRNEAFVLPMKSKAAFLTKTLTALKAGMEGQNE